MSTPQNHAFIPGKILSARFYTECVRPILTSHFPDLPHAAALIGSGSEVLGFDDAMSADHHWGPRVMLFLHADDHAPCADELQHIFAQHLPYEFLGYPTNFSAPDPNDGGVQLLESIDHGPVNHRVESMTVGDFFAGYLGFDIEQPLAPVDWLTFSEHKLCTIADGAIFRDDIGLTAVQAQCAYYPHDVWRYLLACQWARIGQEEHLMGRAGLAGDEIGSALIGARLVRDLMRLCFLMERTYAPYPKWFGTGFRHLKCGPTLEPGLKSALATTDWPSREAALAPLYEAVARMHNTLNLTAPLPETATPFHGRPFRVIAQHGFADALLAGITDPWLKALTARPPIGSLDQFSDNTDLISDASWRPALRGLYGEG